MCKKGIITAVLTLIFLVSGFRTYAQKSVLGSEHVSESREKLKVTDMSESMLLENMNWMDVEEYLKKDDRIVLVTGSTEQHGYLSLATDTQTAWEMAKAACEIEGVILAPALPYGVCPGLMGYPGTVSLDPRTYLDLLDQILRSFVRHGFKRIVIVNGHGGNTFASTYMGAIREDHPEVMIKYCDSNGPKVAKLLEREGETPSNHHADWTEAFPWITHVRPFPNGKKPPLNTPGSYTGRRLSRTPEENRERKDGVGVTGLFYSKDEKIMREYFQAGVEDVLDALREGWEL
jgi:creatinine amidohydrolase